MLRFKKPRLQCSLFHTKKTKVDRYDKCPTSKHLREKLVTDINQDTIDIAPRRGFFRRFGGAITLGLAGLASKALSAETSTAAMDGPNWPGSLQGRHRQVVDAYAANDGFPLAFAYTFLVTNDSATSVVVLRHEALPIALGNPVWEKYKIGQYFKIIDPETKTPAIKNPFLRPKPGVLVADDFAIDRLLARGVVFGACHIALQVQSKMLADNAGVSADEAAKEWAANVVPGITIIPSGTWGVNRAQEAGCTYCAGG
jgi:hypothetical protein